MVQTLYPCLGYERCRYHSSIIPRKGAVTTRGGTLLADEIPGKKAFCERDTIDVRECFSDIHMVWRPLVAVHGMDPVEVSVELGGDPGSGCCPEEIDHARGRLEHVGRTHLEKPD